MGSIATFPGQATDDGQLEGLGVLCVKLLSNQNGRKYFEIPFTHSHGRACFARLGPSFAGGDSILAEFECSLRRNSSARNILLVHPLQHADLSLDWCHWSGRKRGRAPTAAATDLHWLGAVASRLRGRPSGVARMPSTTFLRNTTGSVQFLVAYLLDHVAIFFGSVAVVSFALHPAGWKEECASTKRYPLDIAVRSFSPWFPFSGSLLHH